MACVLAITATVTIEGAAGAGRADPAADALARMTELSRQAERTAESIYKAEIDLEAKLGVQREADERSAAASNASSAAQAELRRYQIAVDQVAATAYMGGSADGISAALTAESPQRLLDELSLNTVMATRMSDRMSDFRQATARAETTERAAEQSAADARLAAEQAAGVAADLQAKQSRLRGQIADVEARYRALTPDQRAALADPGPPPPPVPPRPSNDSAIVAMPDVAQTEAPSAAPGGGGAVVQAALTRVGSPYSWGASGPNAFDCSGLIKWAFLQNGKSLPRSSQALAAGGQPVEVSEVQPGDIVTFYSDASHAGIYVGDGNMVHASTYGVPVKVAPISSAPIYNVRRY